MIFIIRMRIQMHIFIIMWIYAYPDIGSRRKVLVKGKTADKWKKVAHKWHKRTEPPYIEKSAGKYKNLLLNRKKCQ